MPSFHINLDNKFDEIIISLRKKEKNIDIDDLIELKSFIIDIYDKDNKDENDYIRKSFKMIDFKI